MRRTSRQSSSLDKSLNLPFRVPSIHSVPRRARGSFLVLFVVAATLFFLHTISDSSYSVPYDLLPFLKGLPPPEGGRNPPRFYEWYEREKRLPQHDPNLPYPQGRQGRYIRFSNQIVGEYTSAPRLRSLTRRRSSFLQA